MADTGDLKSPGRLRPCGFESRPGYWHGLAPRRDVSAAPCSCQELTTERVIELLISRGTTQSSGSRRMAKRAKTISKQVADYPVSSLRFSRSAALVAARLRGLTPTAKCWHRFAIRLAAIAAVALSCGRQTVQDFRLLSHSNKQLSPEARWPIISGNAKHSTVSTMVWTDAAQ